MGNHSEPSVVPVWTIATEPAKVGSGQVIPIDAKPLTPERFHQLRDALAAYLDTPLVTLERHRLPAGTKLDGGRLLDAASPLATHLADLVRHSSASLPNAAAGGSSETLYRMVLPAKVALQMGTGLVRSMPSAVAQGGVYSGVLGKAGLIGQATFVPAVAEVSVGGVVGAGAGAVGIVGGLTVAAPLVLLAVATAASIYAEEQRRKAIQRVTELLEQLHQNQLDKELDRLTGSSRAIDKAAAVLIDEGRIGHSLGLDSAVNTIDTAIETAARRAASWRAKLGSFPDVGVEVGDLKKAFPGIEDDDGQFRAHLRLASLAVTMKRRVAVLQAVEHAQAAPDNTFPRFTSMLAGEQFAVDALESDLRDLLLDLSRLQLRSPGRTIDKLMFRGEVNDLLKWPTRLRQLAAEESSPMTEGPRDVEIALVQQRDGGLRVLPMAALAG